MDIFEIKVHIKKNIINSSKTFLVTSTISNIFLLLDNFTSLCLLELSNIFLKSSSNFFPILLSSSKFLVSILNKIFLLLFLLMPLFLISFNFEK